MGRLAPLVCFGGVGPRSPSFKLVGIQRDGFKIRVIGLKEEIQRCLGWHFLQGDLWMCLVSVTAIPGRQQSRLAKLCLN